MASLNSEILIKVDHFIKDTRLINCININCKFHNADSFNCKLKEIEIDNKGRCQNRWE